jgi:fructose transport system ATP-binding protein
MAGLGNWHLGDQRGGFGSNLEKEAKMKVEAQEKTTLPPKGTVVLEARTITKRYGHVTALDRANLELRAGEVLAVVGDNGAGKSTLIKVLCGAVIPDEGEVLLDGARVHFRSPLDARKLGIETVYQDLAVAPALDIATNLFLGREVRRKGALGSWLRLLDKSRMKREAQHEMDQLKFHLPGIDSAVEKLSGGQRQGVAVARAAIFARRLVIMDEPTAALGVRESGQVLNLIRTIRDRGLPVILISHDMPHVFEVADRIQIMRLGRRAALTSPQKHTMSEVVAIMTGAAQGDEG